MLDVYVAKPTKADMTRSAYADRDTVGTLALNALECKERVVVGDMSHEFMPQLVEDLNDAITSNPFDDRPFYITIHEKKDAQLTNVMLRRVLKGMKRPYPEPATTVFWTDPKTHETLFCWSLPHWSNFPNYFANPQRYSKEQLKDIVAYQMHRMDHFGFRKVAETEDKVPVYSPIPNFKDRKMENRNRFSVRTS